MSYASNYLNTYKTHLPEYLPSSKCGKFCGVYNLNLAMMKIAWLNFMHLCCEMEEMGQEKTTSFNISFQSVHM